MSRIIDRDGWVDYLGLVFDERQSGHYFEKLMGTIEWERDELVMFGKRLTTKREVAWVGDSNKVYRYSGSVKLPLMWTEELLEIKAMVEKVCGASFNSCLLNLYHNGGEGMGWHSDDEPELGQEPLIASLSLGATRTFMFKHKLDGEMKKLDLENGSLLIMGGPLQKHWKHSLPKRLKVKEARINLTFRTLL